MDIIFEVIDYTGRKIRLTKKQWSHIMKRHPYMIKYIEEIKETLKKPQKITSYSLDSHIRYYYRNYQNLVSPNRYILIIVKYLNNHGFVISTYRVSNIR